VEVQQSRHLVTLGGLPLIALGTGQLGRQDQPSPLGASATDSPLSALSRFSAADSRRRRTRRERHAVGRPDLPVRPAPTGTQVRLFLRAASLRLLGGARPPEALPPRQRHLAACPE